MLYIILAQGFCPLKIKITQYPGGFGFYFMLELCKSVLSFLLFNCI